MATANTHPAKNITLAQYGGTLERTLGGKAIDANATSVARWLLDVRQSMFTPVAHSAVTPFHVSIMSYEAEQTPGWGKTSKFKIPRNEAILVAGMQLQIGLTPAMNALVSANDFCCLQGAAGYRAVKSVKVRYGNDDIEPFTGDSWFFHDYRSRTEDELAVYDKSTDILNGALGLTDLGFDIRTTATATADNYADLRSGLDIATGATTALVYDQRILCLELPWSWKETTDSYMPIGVLGRDLMVEVTWADSDAHVLATRLTMADHASAALGDVKLIVEHVHLTDQETAQFIALSSAEAGGLEYLARELHQYDDEEIAANATRTTYSMDLTNLAGPITSVFPVIRATSDIEGTTGTFYDARSFKCREIDTLQLKAQGGALTPVLNHNYLMNVYGPKYRKHKGMTVPHYAYHFAAQPMNTQDSTGYQDFTNINNPKLEITRTSTGEVDNVLDTGNYLHYVNQYFSGGTEYDDVSAVPSSDYSAGRAITVQVFYNLAQIHTVKGKKLTRKWRA